MWTPKGGVLIRGQHSFFSDWHSFTFIALFLYYLTFHTISCYNMSILKVRAEISTQLLIHKINCKVSGMIFYVISNPKFLWPSFTNFSTKYRTITSTLGSFNMTTLFHLCVTAWLTFTIMGISVFLILLGQHNQLFLQFHGLFL